MDAARAGGRFVANSPHAAGLIAGDGVHLSCRRELSAAAVGGCHKLGLGSIGYGLLLGCIGVGALGGLMLGSSKCQERKAATRLSCSHRPRSAGAPSPPRHGATQTEPAQGPGHRSACAARYQTPAHGAPQERRWTACSGRAEPAFAITGPASVRNDQRRRQSSGGAVTVSHDRTFERMLRMPQLGPPPPMADETCRSQTKARVVPGSGLALLLRSAAVGCELQADVAQLVERCHGKAEVSGSIPDVGSFFVPQAHQQLGTLFVPGCPLLSFRARATNHQHRSQKCALPRDRAPLGPQYGKQEVSGSNPDVGLLSSLLPSPTGRVWRVEEEGRRPSPIAGGAKADVIGRTVPMRPAGCALTALTNVLAAPITSRRRRHESPRSAPCPSDEGCCPSSTT